MKDRPPPRRPTVWSRLDRDQGASGGYDLAASVLVGWGLGWVSQRFWGVPEPWGLLVGIVLGSASGFYQLFKIRSVPKGPKASAGDDERGGGRA